jgi:hypothetical protein
MNKFLAAAVVVLLVANAALADGLPPPPPKGKKYVSVTNEVVLDKDVSGYVFVRQVVTGFGAPSYTHTKVELTPGKAAAVADGGRRASVSLLAVPQDAAKEFKTDAELFDALKANKVKGVHRIVIPGTATVSDTVKAASVKWTHTITAVDEKGAKTKVEGEGYEPTGPKTKDRPPLAQAGTMVAGVALALALAFGGLWLTGRSRRKV